jgi:hypothetical protein
MEIDLSSAMEREGVRHMRINIKDIMFKLRMTT